MKKTVVFLIMCVTLGVNAQNFRDIIGPRTDSEKRDYGYYEVMREKAFKIYRNDERAKDRAVIISNDEGYTAIIYKGKFFFIRDYNYDRITEVIKSELQKSINTYRNAKIIAENDFEKEDDLVADYKQKLKADKAINPVNGGHRHEIEKALDLHQGRLTHCTEELEKATKKVEDIEKECALLYKELDIIIGKYYEIRDKQEEGKGFACVI
jgi:hypothetical protein